MIAKQDIAWEKMQGLIPAIVQHAHEQSVLMLAYMNEAAFEHTLASGQVTFFSRSKQRLWTKGETSGHILQLKDIKLDCDGDTLLVSALPHGPSCHKGTETCWGDVSTTSMGFLQALDALLDQRFQQKPEGSYTTELFNAGTQRMAQKVGEEGVEVALAAMLESKDELLGEAADLLFHLMVLLRSKQLHLADVVQVLRHRHASA